MITERENLGEARKEKYTAQGFVSQAGKMLKTEWHREIQGPSIYLKRKKRYGRIKSKERERGNRRVWPL